jgi:hypothetical protein
MRRALFRKQLRVRFLLPISVKGGVVVRSHRRRNPRQKHDFVDTAKPRYPFYKGFRAVPQAKPLDKMMERPHAAAATALIKV